MFTSSKHISLATLAALSVATATAPAQMMHGNQMMQGSTFRSIPTVMTRQATLNQAMTGQVGPSTGTTSPAINAAAIPPTNQLNSFAAPAGPFAGYANPYAALTTNPYSNTSAGYGASGLGSSTQNPYGGSGYGSYYESIPGAYLRGTADLITSQGKWLQSLQQAGLLQEQNRQAMIETRRKSFSESVYERQNTPTFEQERERVSRLDLRRSLNDPPASEIWSGQALNTILADLAKRQPEESSEPNIALDEDLQRHINIVAGHGSAGLLKSEGRLSWPLALVGDSYKSDRELLNALLPAAMNQALNGQVETSTLRQMTRSVQQMHRQLATDISDLTATQYMGANRFLANLDDGLKVLSRADAGDFLTRKYTAQGRTVAELVKHMVAQGLTFGPANSGEEGAYETLYRALAAYAKSPKAHVATEGK
jgi:hypothetical protein